MTAHDHLLPGHARGRYTIVVHGPAPAAPGGEADGEAGPFALVIQRADGALRVSHEDYQRVAGEPVAPVPEDLVPGALAGMVRYADSLRHAGDGIGELARAAVALESLARRLMRAQPPDPAPVRPVHLDTAFAHLGTILESLGNACADMGDLSRQVGELAEYESPEEARHWSRMADMLRVIQSGAARVSMAAEQGQAVADCAVVGAFTCGDCLVAECHWGAGDTTRPKNAAARRAQGEECGCARHEISVDYARLAYGRWDGDPVESAEPVAALGLRYEGGAAFDPGAPLNTPERAAALAGHLRAGTLPGGELGAAITTPGGELDIARVRALWGVEVWPAMSRERVADVLEAHALAAGAPPAPRRPSMTPSVVAAERDQDPGGRFVAGDDDGAGAAVDVDREAAARRHGDPSGPVDVTRFGSDTMRLDLPTGGDQ